MNLQQLNQLPPADLAVVLANCCGATHWQQQLVMHQPFASIEGLLACSDQVWNGLQEADYLEAFTHHPMIGDIDALKQKFAATAHWAGQEQQGSQQASEDTLVALQQGNQQYLDQFGFIFIVCATGKSADEMLSLLRARMNNDYSTELAIAATEQNKITHLRLHKLLTD